MSDQTNTTPESAEPSSAQPLDRTHAPAVPDALTDLWAGWGYNKPAGVADLTVGAAKVALDGVSTIVNAMAGGDRYSVRLAAGGTAWTDLQSHRVQVTSAALADPRLTVDEALGVTTGMAMHEAGHGRLTPPMQRAMVRRFGAPNGINRRAYRLSNIVDDVRLEARTATRWPAYGPLFDLTMWWVAQRYPSGAITRLPGSKDEAVNFCLAATRYGPHTQWASDAAIEAERTWWVEWMARATATDKPADHVRAIEEALTHINPLPERPEPKPSGDEPEPTGEGEGEPNGDDDGGSDGGTDDGDGEGEGEGEGEDQQDRPAPHPFRPMVAAMAAHDEATCADCGLPASDPVHVEQQPDDDGRGKGKGKGEYPGKDDGGDNPVPGGDGGTPIHQDPDDVIIDPTDGERRIVDDETEHGSGGHGGDGTQVEQQPERDALSDPLPLHATDATDADDAARDASYDGAIEARATWLDRESINVDHSASGGGTVTVQIKPLDTQRTHIVTNTDAQSALRGAFVSRRTSHDARDVARSGRVSGRRAYRAAAGFDNIFTRRDAISPDRLDVHLLVDASGSMRNRINWNGPRRLDMAAQMSANITEALARIPTIRVHVWSHNEDYDGTVLTNVYDSRQHQPLGRIAGINAGGSNRDASAIAALTAKIVQERSNRERSIMVVISDGEPCEPHPWVAGAVNAARSQKIGVVSVAIVGGLSRTQEECYGPDAVVPWTGDWDALARGIALIVGQMA